MGKVSLLLDRDVKDKMVLFFWRAFLCANVNISLSCNHEDKTDTLKRRTWKDLKQQVKNKTMCGWINELTWELPQFVDFFLWLMRHFCCGFSGLQTKLPDIFFLIIFSSVIYLLRSMIFGVEYEKIWCPEFILIVEYQPFYQMFQNQFPLWHYNQCKF